ncbi:MAG: glycosyltransferase [Candidatus Zixiibacteriota bacterium]
MDFIVFSDDWDRHPSSSEHLFRQLLNDNRVVWVNTIGARAPRLTVNDMKRSVEKLISWVPLKTHDTPGGGHSTDPNLTVISPVILPYFGSRVVRKLNTFAVERKILNVVGDAARKDAVLFSSHPHVVDFFRAFPEFFKIYYCVDDYTLMPGTNKDLIKRLESELIADCDLIFYTARYLESKFTGFENKIEYLPHGVDYSHFAARANADLRRRNTKPVIGFFGLLDEWVDTDMIYDIAYERTDWHIVLIGRAEVNLDKLLSLKNVERMNAVPYIELPSYANRFDVGIIPFRINELTKAVNPVKFLEYMAMGIPVVSTSLPELHRFGSEVYFGDTSGQFIARIEQALKEDSSERRDRRKQIAAANSWTNQSRKLTESIRARQKVLASDR